MDTQNIRELCWNTSYKYPDLWESISFALSTVVENQTQGSWIDLPIQCSTTEQYSITLQAWAISCTGGVELLNIYMHLSSELDLSIKREPSDWLSLCNKWSKIQFQHEARCSTHKVTLLHSCVTVLPMATQCSWYLGKLHSYNKHSHITLVTTVENQGGLTHKCWG